MALNSSGQISLGGSTVGQSVNLELGLSSTAQISLNDTTVRTLAGISGGQIGLSNLLGKSKGTGGGFYTASPGWVGGITRPFYQTVYSITYNGNYYGSGSVVAKSIIDTQYLYVIEAGMWIGSFTFTNASPQTKNMTFIYTGQNPTQLDVLVTGNMYNNVTIDNRINISSITIPGVGTVYPGTLGTTYTTHYNLIWSYTANFATGPGYIDVYVGDEDGANYSAFNRCLNAGDLDVIVYQDGINIGSIVGNGRINFTMMQANNSTFSVYTRDTITIANTCGDLGGEFSSSTNISFVYLPIQ
ncbi:hypothetical protein [Geobacter sp. SVR]|uniref:hypothetical protein n=1 Tax=Geobacter sp. SVR TaxID=2495594 RepID=UPI00143EF9DF|nr:hypothetical protein [Geobacter sp. SVR]BCS54063.1 hypothetical protein GSVR_23710 [Geobacter sp. SVR]GCF87546.1 hypothetical protein GSbR_41460 [Geobacter sp. SVR]